MTPDTDKKIELQAAISDLIEYGSGKPMSKASRCIDMVLHSYPSRETSAEVASVAARRMTDPDPEVRSLAASALGQAPANDHPDTVAVGQAGA